jgi:hypothetical protein
MKQKLDPKYLGIPNICFSITDKNDDREEYFINQRLERGFDDSETWSLRDTIALFIIPRLKRYQEIANRKIHRDVELVNDIDSFIKAMEEEKQMYEGIEKFSKIFMTLSW